MSKAETEELTGAIFDQLCDTGYVIIHNFLPEAQRAEMAAAIRRLLKPWDEVKHDPPPNPTAHCYFPYPEQCLNAAIINPEVIRFAKKWLGTKDIHYRPGLALVRYPGFTGHSGVPHIDNGNNSLLSPSESDRSYGQLNFWFYLEDVAEDQAPTCFISKADGQDLNKAEAFVAFGGSLAIFDNYNWHTASDYTRSDGQRYIWKSAYGRADHYWEGVEHYTQFGRNHHFRTFIGSLTAKERELFRFPPAGHAYYTPQTLAALEEQYPGWNQRGEYNETPTCVSV